MVCGAATYAVQEFKGISDNVRLLQVADIGAMEKYLQIENLEHVGQMTNHTSRPIIRVADRL